jgi:hypothetical protein
MTSRDCCQVVKNGDRTGDDIDDDSGNGNEADDEKLENSNGVTANDVTAMS